jgi:hypothetical protein
MCPVYFVTHVPGCTLQLWLRTRPTDTVVAADAIVLDLRAAVPACRREIGGTGRTILRGAPSLVVAKWVGLFLTARRSSSARNGSDYFSNAERVAATWEALDL